MAVVESRVLLPVGEFFCAVIRGNDMPSMGEGLSLTSMGEAPSLRESGKSGGRMKEWENISGVDRTWAFFLCSLSRGGLILALECSLRAPGFEATQSMPKFQNFLFWVFWWPSEEGPQK